MDPKNQYRCSNPDCHDLITYNKYKFLVKSNHPHCLECNQGIYEILADEVDCHEFEFNQLGRLIEYLREPEQDPQALQVLQRDFKNFYEQYDQRRGKNFRHTFPQLADWYDTL